VVEIDKAGKWSTKSAILRQHGEHRLRAVTLPVGRASGLPKASVSSPAGVFITSVPVLALQGQALRPALPGQRSVNSTSRPPFAAPNVFKIPLVPLMLFGVRDGSGH